MPKRYENETYVGERAQFMSKDAQFFNCVFEDGESPLKESRNLDIEKCEFRWKYPIWYCRDVKCRNITFLETARSGIWYTNDIVINDSTIYAPKTFRRCDGVKLINVQLLNAQETFWNCKKINLNHVYAKGDYFGFNCDGVEAEDLHIDGNYCFDGAKNIVIRNSALNSKDSFWNTENVTIIDCDIDGEYIGWNSKNLTFINCKIRSHQGLCYIEGLKLVNCELVETDLCFEFCSKIDAQINSVVDSIKNPISGEIRLKGVKELIMDENIINPRDTKIIVE